MELKQANPSITDSALRLPSDVPEIPPEVIERFPEMAGWMSEFRRFWSANTNAVNDFARAVLDVTEIGGLFVVDGANTSIYIKGTRDRGAYADTDTPFYADKKGFFSLGSHLTWNPETLILTIDGTIFAEAGNIGGFDLGPDFIRDEGDSFGLASTVTGGNDVRFWAGSSFAARDTAPFRVYEDGSIFASMGTIGGFVLGTDFIRDAANSFGLASTVTGGDDTRFFAGQTFANRATAPFRVTEAGVVTAISGTIGGWTLSATTLSGTNAVLSSVGTLLLGTANDVAILDANDATYRLWIGNATAGSATFSVTKAGALFSTSGLIGGFTIGATSLSAGTGPTSISLSTVVTAGLSVGEPAGLRSVHRAGTGGTSASFYLFNTSNVLVGSFEAQSSHQGGRLTLNNTASTQVIDIDIDALVAKSTITFDGDTNIYRDSANTLKTDDAFVSSSVTTGAVVGTTGSFSGQVSAASFNTTSSKKFKTNIRTLTGGLEIVRQLRAVVFDWRTKNLDGDIGFIAEEMMDVLPMMVGLDTKGQPAGVDYGRITAVLVKAIQELEERIDGLRL
jgi:hypothetical protein